MAKIPKQVSKKVTPSGRVGDVSIPFDIADTGAGIEARGLGALGRGIGALGEALFRIEEAEGISQFATARNLANVDVQAFELAQQTNADPSSYQGNFTQTFEEMNAHRPKNRIGAKRFDDWLAGQESLWRVGVAGLANRKVLQIAEGAYISNKAAAISQGNLLEVEKVIAEAEATGVITPKQAARDLLSVPSLIIKSQIQTLLNQAEQFISQGSSVSAATSIAQAEELVNSAKGLDTDTERLLRSRIRTSKTQIKSDSEATANQAVEDSFAKIREKDTDIASMVAAIQNNPNISAEDSNKAARTITAFYSSWNSATSFNVVTSNATRIKALEIKNRVLNNKITRDEGLALYKEIKEPINPTDNKSFINDIFTAAQSAKDVVKQRQGSAFDRREKQLRDSIEKQPNVFFPDEATEILKDFANAAVIELNNKFPTDTEFTDDDVKTEVDILTIRYTLSALQQSRAVIARELRLAETLQAQQESITKIVESLRKEGKTEQAKEIMDEAIALGIFEQDGEKIKKKKGKEKARISEGLWKRLREQFR